jgi:hypothetical protein
MATMLGTNTELVATTSLITVTPMDNTLISVKEINGQTALDMSTISTVKNINPR